MLPLAGAPLQAQRVERGPAESNVARSNRSIRLF